MAALPPRIPASVPSNDGGPAPLRPRAATLRPRRDGAAEGTAEGARDHYLRDISAYPLISGEAAAELAAPGYPTACETDGDAVLRLVRAEVMRLVVSELYIPCAEGPCVVAALKRERARLPRLRVLAHTRHTSPEDDVWALAAGCDGVLHKPGSAGALVREVRRLEGTDPREPGSATGDERRRP